MKEAIEPLTWEMLSEFAAPETNNPEGDNNPYALERFFGRAREQVRVTLYRDNHAWCPYCQKIWLWLEWKRIPYKVKKATMRCYGKKEEWYLKKVPSGMFPAIEIDQKIITESDQILLSLETVFGPLGKSLQNPQIIDLRNLERKLFKAWCMWLCIPSLVKSQEARRAETFKVLAHEMEQKIEATKTPWLDPVFNNSSGYLPGSVDIVFIPYVERMNASLAYYKGFNLRQSFPKIDSWLKELEKHHIYRGTQSDFHTHAHDLPPQMGGCWFNKSPKQKEFSEKIDIGQGLGAMETTFQEKKNQSEAIALSRVLKHRKNIISVNPLGDEQFDQPLRAALSKMILGKSFKPNEETAIGLRYLKDRISVPRDMPLLSARKLRQALEHTASIDSSTQGPKISTRDRFDQDPTPFKT